MVLQLPFAGLTVLLILFTESNQQYRIHNNDVVFADELLQVKLMYPVT